MFPILPHDMSLNCFGLAAFAKEDSHAMDDLKALLYVVSSSLPPVVGSAPTLFRCMTPLTIFDPSRTTALASHFVSLPDCTSPSIQMSIVNSAHSL